MNRQLAEQNQKLFEQLQKLTQNASTSPEGGPPPEPALPAVPDTGPGPGGNVISSLPSTGAAAAGGDLISFDPKDVKGVPMVSRFGRRFTNNGLWFESADKNYQFHVGGRTQMDVSSFSAGNRVQFGSGGIGKLRDGIDPRRMRIRLEGSMYENFLYVMEVDFVNTAVGQGPNLGRAAGTDRLTSVANTPALGSPVPLELWIGARKIPYIGNIRIGNQKEPFGFERMVSSRYLNFMERSFNQDAFYSPFSNGFDPGITTYNVSDDLRTTYAAGVYKVVTNGYVYDIGGGDIKFTGRLTHLFLYEHDGKELMHVGISARQADYDNGLQRLRVRGPERAGLSTLWPNYADTGVFAGHGGQQDLNIELVNVFGPLSIDAEYNFHWSQNAFQAGKPGVGTLFYSGGYVEVLYFLTGENRAYVRESGLYDRVIPKENAFWVKGEKNKPNTFGHGAWQVGIRYNYLNLSDKGINGSVLNDMTLGLNWFINPNAKFQWNYSYTERHSGTGQSDGPIQGLGMRYAMDY